MLKSILDRMDICLGVELLPSFVRLLSESSSGLVWENQEPQNSCIVKEIQGPQQEIE